VVVVVVVVVVRVVVRVRRVRGRLRDTQQRLDYLGLRLRLALHVRLVALQALGELRQLLVPLLLVLPQRMGLDLCSFLVKVQASCTIESEHVDPALPHHTNSVENELTF